MKTPRYTLSIGTKITVVVDAQYDGGVGSLCGIRKNGSASIQGVVGGCGGDVYQAENADGTRGQYCYTEMEIE